ncbi:hypothetical protein AB0E69_24020 [Kribbella sp. NPDC026611]|uniref:hypothetical protein n=1 Tax=Kribbella sp. NPDC026611 TaxID=3154911 RepID=UPI0033EFB5E1
MPTYSDDGQWWWDGRSWRPLAELPPQQQPQYSPPQQYAPPQQQYPPQQYTPQQQGFYNPPPPKKKTSTGLIVGLLVVALVVLSGGGVLVWKLRSSKSGDSTADAPHGKTIEPGQPVTAETLAEVDPQTFFEGVAKRQMTQPLARYKMTTFGDQQNFLSRTKLWTVVDSAIDHESNQFYYAQTFMDHPTEQQPTSSICKGGKSYSWSYLNKVWQVVPFDSPECTKPRGYGTGDALFASGLTDSQADTVLAKLRSYKGYVNPAKPTLLSAGGKTYVRQVVDFTPIILSNDSYGGTAISMWAFRDAGLDPVTWPWSNPYPLGVGIHAVYYLDTQTLLPVAAFQKGIPAPAHGSDEAIPAPEVQVINYSFPKTLPVPVLNKSNQALTITPPEGWKLQ